MSEDFEQTLGAQYKACAMDLADEAHRLLSGRANIEVRGVSQQVLNYRFAKVTIIKILNAEGEKRMGRPCGSYITIDAPLLRREHTDSQLAAQISALIARNIKSLLPPLRPDVPVMVIGLGNLATLPDALGPQTVQQILPTSHLYSQLDATARRQIQSLCSFIPGVMGDTGLESSALIYGAVQSVQPQCLIIIDALAAGSVNRITTTVQLSDTGIRPGSGVANHRQSITPQTLGIPIIALGVPTVVHANVIIHEALENLTQGLPYLKEDVHEGIKSAIATNMLQAFNGELVVTPKEVDHLIPHTARLLAAGIVQALHPAADGKNYQMYLQ